MSAAEEKATVAAPQHPVALDYAARSTGRRPWNMQVRLACILTAVASSVLGLSVREDIGSGVFILNPLRLLAVATLYLAAGTYAVVRIWEEEKVPGWARAAMVACMSVCGVLVPLAYHAWNRWRMHRWQYAFQDERVTRPLAGILGAVVVFAAVRTFLWWRIRRQSG